MGNNPPQHVFVFAETPSLLNNDPIDYGLPEGIKLFKSNTAKLSHALTTKPEELLLTIEEVRRRVVSANWTEIVTIPVGMEPNNTPITRNLLDEPGMITMEQVRAHALTYCNTETRNAQNANQMYTCLSESVDLETRVKLLADTDLYRVGPANSKKYNGPCYLKLLIQKASVDTRSTLALLRRNMNTLDIQIGKLGFDIEKFHDYVKSQIRGLASRGAIMDAGNVMTNLQLAYMTVPDQTFKSYMTRLQDDYNDDRRDFTVDSLMEAAVNKYKTIVEAGQWQAHSPEQEKIIALQAKIDRWEKKSPPKKSEPKKKKGKGKDKDGEGKRKAEDKKWAWKLKAPPANAPRTKQFEAKTYHWCPKHAAWTVHLPADCRKGEAPSETAVATPIRTPSNKVDAANSLKLNSALVSILDDEDEFE